MDHGITKGKEPLTALPQIFPIGLDEASIQPLGKKMKTKWKLSATICDICKSTRWISTWVNLEKLHSATSVPSICHKALPEDRLVTLNAHNALSFAMETIFHGLFSLVHLGGRLKRFQ